MLWHLVVDFSLEKLAALAAFGWGLAVTVVRPLGSSPGWHYLVWMLAWQPLPADAVFGPLLCGVGARQFWLALHTWSRLEQRAAASLLTGLIFCFFTFALLLGQRGATGVPVYALLAWAGFVAFYQLTLRARSRALA